jgi:hypothetical protein
MVVGRSLCRVVLVAVLSLGTVMAVQTPAHATETWADIVCRSYDPLPVKEVISKAWGVDYPRNIEITVYRTFHVNGEWWRSTTNHLFTSGSGSWSTPTNTFDATFMSGDFDLRVIVTDASGIELDLPKDDRCTM